MSSIACEYALKHFVFSIFSSSVITGLIIEKLIKLHANSAEPLFLHRPKPSENLFPNKNPCVKSAIIAQVTDTP